MSNKQLDPKSEQSPKTESQTQGVLGGGTPPRQGTPFRILISGSSNCGKTYYMMKYLLEQHRGDFDYVFLLCPTFLHNETYVKLMPNDQDIFMCDCEALGLDNTLAMISKIFRNQGDRVLIIVDDCAGGNEVKNRTSQLVKFFYHGRHFGMSVIVLSQQLTSIAKPIRDNITRLVAFYLPDGDDMDLVLSKYLRKYPEADTKKICKHLMTNKYSKLVIDMEFPFGYYVE